MREGFDSGRRLCGRDELQRPRTSGTGHSRDRARNFAIELFRVDFLGLREQVERKADMAQKSDETLPAMQKDDATGDQAIKISASPVNQNVSVVYP